MKPYRYLLLVFPVWFVLLGKAYLGMWIQGYSTLYRMAGDTESYVLPAERLLHQGIYAGEKHALPEGRIPGYPLTYLVIRLIAGERHSAFFVLVILQTLLAAMACVALAYTLSQITRNRWILGAVLIGWILMPHWAWYDSMILAESLFTSAQVLSFVFLVHGIRKKNFWLFLAAGLTIAYAYLLRPVGFATGIAVSTVLALLTLFPVTRPLVLNGKGWVNYSLPLLVAGGLWGSHVYKTTGEFALSQSGKIHIALSQPVKSCLTGWANCPVYGELIQTLALAGKPYIPWEPGGKLISWFLFPDTIVCHDPAYAVNCADIYEIVQELAPLSTKHFPIPRLMRLRDSLLSGLYGSHLPDSTRFHILQALIRDIQLWRKELQNEKPWLIFWGRTRLFIRGLFPSGYQSLSPDPLKRRILQIYYRLTQAYLWSLSAGALLFVAMMIWMIFRAPYREVSWIAVFLGIYAWVPLLAYWIMNFHELRYFHPQFYLFLPATLWVLEKLVKRFSH